MLPLVAASLGATVSGRDRIIAHPFVRFFSPSCPRKMSPKHEGEVRQDPLILGLLNRQRQNGFGDGGAIGTDDGQISVRWPFMSQKQTTA